MRLAILALATAKNVTLPTPSTVTVHCPRGWPLGTCTVSWVAVAADTAERFPPKRTMLFAGFVSKPLPFLPSDTVLANEEMRLKYRYINLRRDAMQFNIELRHKVAKAIRDYL